MKEKSLFVSYISLLISLFIPSYLVLVQISSCIRYVFEMMAVWEESLLYQLGWIQDLMKGGLDRRPPKAVKPLGVSRGMLPRKIFNFRAAGAIWSGLIALKSPPPSHFFNHAFVIRFYVQFRGFDRTTRTTPKSAPDQHTSMGDRDFFCPLWANWEADRRLLPFQ